ncbi:MAG: hypothetical protein EZS28_001550 [Streblomastix strix]|uniref:Uncharacterized protein n=1 Tax=Streblomastix strix TaxID=222440 RepID=A0A5J4X840_9EUKA|nr:MAG: hypothetical protein EZS28_001550 [Streblomastix strix]
MPRNKATQNVIAALLIILEKGSLIKSKYNKMINIIEDIIRQGINSLNAFGVCEEKPYSFNAQLQCICGTIISHPIVKKIIIAIIINFKQGYLAPFRLLPLNLWSHRNVLFANIKNMCIIRKITEKEQSTTCGLLKQATLSKQTLYDIPSSFFSQAKDIPIAIIIPNADAINPNSIKSLDQVTIVNPVNVPKSFATLSGSPDGMGIV